VTVVGAAVARRAARELQEAAGVPSTSLAGLLVELRRGGEYALAPGSVVVLDEASMVASRDLGELVEHVRSAAGKLVLCGDHRQLPSIRAGGAFRAVAARTHKIELSENRRQSQPWEREALDQLRDGEAIEAIGVYEANERLVLGGDRTVLMKRLVDDWWAARSSGTSAMIALRRADVRELNTQARQRMRAAGELGPDIALECGIFAPGDRIVLRRNDRRLGIANGELATVKTVDATGGMIIEAAGRRVTLPAWYLESAAQRPRVQHAYAITGHVAQGMTVDHAFVLGSPELYREWGYTAMSRGRHGNRLYVMAPDDPDRSEIAPREQDPSTALASLVRGMTTSRAQTAAIDAGQAQQIRNASTRELQRRAGHLRVEGTDPELADAVAEYETLTAALDQVRRELNSAKQQLASLRRDRPPRIRTQARTRHQRQEQQLQTTLSSRLAAAETAAAARQRAAEKLNSMRTERIQAGNGRGPQLELIRDELERRTALERAARLSISLDQASSRRSLG